MYIHDVMSITTYDDAHHTTITRNETKNQTPKTIVRTWRIHAWIYIHTCIDGAAKTLLLSPPSVAREEEEQDGWENNNQNTHRHLWIDVLQKVIHMSRGHSQQIHHGT